MKEQECEELEDMTELGGGMKARKSKGLQSAPCSGRSSSSVLTCSSVELSRPPKSSASLSSYAPTASAEYAASLASSAEGTGWPHALSPGAWEPGRDSRSTPGGQD